MSSTNSLSFPNMFDVSRNSVAVAKDGNSVANRTRLLILTEPTELYNNPLFGVGLRKHIWQYNIANQTAIIKDKIIEQLKLYEPCVEAEKTTIIDGLKATENGNPSISAQEYNKLKLTVMVVTKFGDKVEVNLNNE